MGVSEEEQFFYRVSSMSELEAIPCHSNGNISMNFIPQEIKQRIAQYVLRFSPKVERLRQGSSLREMKSIVILYTDVDEAKYKLVRDIATYIKKEFGVKRVMRVAYIEEESKFIPAWHLRKLEADYFCKSDLNWFGRPTRNIEPLIQESFDVLIHFDPDSSLALDFFVLASKAKMKVSNHSELRKKDYDILLPPTKGDNWKQRNHRIIQFLAESPLS
jgi:hypothetical protein